MLVKWEFFLSSSITLLKNRQRNEFSCKNSVMSNHLSLRTLVNIHPVLNKTIKMILNSLCRMAISMTEEL